MTHNQIVSAIENYVTSTLGVNNTRIPREQIFDEVNTLRCRMAGDLFVKTKQISHEFYQNIPLTFTTRDCLLEDGDRDVMQSTIPIIYVKPLVNEYAIEYLGPRGKYKRYRIVTGSHHIYAKHDKFIGTYPTAHIEGNICSIFTSGLMKEGITLRAMLINPSEAKNFGISYDEETTEYPCPSSIQDQIIGKTVLSYINTFNRMSQVQPNTQADLALTNIK